MEMVDVPDEYTITAFAWLLLLLHLTRDAIIFVLYGLIDTRVNE